MCHQFQDNKQVLQASLHSRTCSMAVSKDPKQYFKQHNDTYSTRFEIYLTIAQFLKSLYLKFKFTYHTVL